MSPVVTRNEKTLRCVLVKRGMVYKENLWSGKEKVKGVKKTFVSVTWHIYSCDVAHRFVRRGASMT